LFTHINRIFLALGDVIGKDAFQSHMRKVFEGTISRDRWEEDKLKFGYTDWMQDNLIDALYNTEPILEKYRKLQKQLLNEEQLIAFKTKVSNFIKKTKNWSKRSRKSAAHWHQGTPTEMLLQGNYLINFNDKMKVTYVEKSTCGGNREIQKCFIQGDPAIPKLWEFAAKKQKGDTVAVQKVRFNAEAMALQSAHKSCIKWIAVHPSKPEEYTLWWNSRTILEMLRDEVRFNREDVHITFQVAILIDSRDDYQKKLELATRVDMFRKKCHELAWTFSNTMNNVHHCHTLHKNISPDNVLLHFPPNFPDKVHIGICDWAIVRNFNDLKDSLYNHENEEAKTRII
jgi:hypothetical protein